MMHHNAMQKGSNQWGCWANAEGVGSGLTTCLHQIVDSPLVLLSVAAIRSLCRGLSWTTWPILLQRLFNSGVPESIRLTCKLQDNRERASLSDPDQIYSPTSYRSSDGRCDVVWGLDHLPSCNGNWLLPCYLKLISSAVYIYLIQMIAIDLRTAIDKLNESVGNRVQLFEAYILVLIMEKKRGVWRSPVVDRR